MTKIEVEGLIGNETLKRRRWVFSLVDTTLLLRVYVVEERISRRHKWRPQNAYSWLSLDAMDLDCKRIKLAAVPLPSWVVRVATKKLSALIIVTKSMS